MECECGDPEAEHDEVKGCQLEYREGDSEYEWAWVVCPCPKFRPREIKP